VEFSSPEDARRAIATMNDAEIKGRAVLVREDREAKGFTGPPPTRAADPPASHHGDDHAKVFVGNLSWKVAWQDLKDFCGTVGPVAFCDIPTNEKGQSKGFGLVRFESASDAARACSVLNGKMLHGREVSVRMDRDLPPVATTTRAAPGRGSTGEVAVRISNVPLDFDWRAVKDALSSLKLRGVAHTECTPGSGTAMVKFSDAAAAADAMAANGSTVNGHVVSFSYA
jgi:RNA recognition motif-containing protein